MKGRDRDSGMRSRPPGVRGRGDHAGAPPCSAHAAHDGRPQKRPAQPQRQHGRFRGITRVSTFLQGRETMSRWAKTTSHNASFSGGHLWKPAKSSTSAGPTAPSRVGMEASRAQPLHTSPTPGRPPTLDDARRAPAAPTPAQGSPSQHPPKHTSESTSQPPGASAWGPAPTHGWIQRENYPIPGRRPP